MKNEQLELIQKQQAEREKLMVQKSRAEKVTKAIRNVEDFIPVLKNHVVEKHSFDAHMLKQLRDDLDSVEDNIEFVKDIFPHHLLI